MRNCCCYARGGYSHSERIPPCHSLCGNVCLLVHSWPLLTCLIAMHHLDQDEYNSYLCFLFNEGSIVRSCCYARGRYSHSERIPPCHSLRRNACLLVHYWPLLACFVAMHHLDQEKYNSYLCCCSMRVL